MTHFRDGGFPDPCAICAHLVLGLEGEDRYLTPFELSEEWKLGLEVAGACHLKCLVESDYGEIWGMGTRDHHLSRWPLFSESRDAGWRVHCDPFWMRLYVVYDDGRITRVSAAALVGDVSTTEDEVDIPVTSVVGYAGGQFDSVFRYALKGSEEGVRLSSILAELDIDDRLLRPDLFAASVVRHGVVRAGTDKNSASSKVYQADHLISLGHPEYQTGIDLVKQAATMRRRAYGGRAPDWEPSGP